MRIGITSASRRQSLDSMDSTEYGVDMGQRPMDGCGDHTGVEFVNNRATGIILHHPCTCKSMYFLDGCCLAVKRHEVRRNVA